MRLLLLMIERVARCAGLGQCTDTQCGGRQRLCCKLFARPSVCARRGARCEGCCGWINGPTVACTNVSEPHKFDFPRDVGPHLNFSGELWWYLGVLDAVNVATGAKRTLGLQLSFIRGTSVCGASAWPENTIVSDFAIADVPPELQSASPPTFRYHHRIDAAGAAHLKGTTMRTLPYALTVGSSLAQGLGAWGVSALGNVTGGVQVLDAHSVAMRAHLQLSVPATNHLMGRRGVGHACDAWYHVSKPRLAVRDGWIALPSGNYSVASAAMATEAGEAADGGKREGADARAASTSAGANALWLQHIWWSANGACGGRLPTWDWMYLHLDDGSNLAVVLFLDDVAIVPGACRGLSNSYGNLISPDGAVNTLLNATNGELCVKAKRPWTSNASNLTYATAHTIEIELASGEALVLDVATLMDDNEVSFGALPIAYYEGASRALGVRTDAGGGVRPLAGRGFTEHQGYSTASINKKKRG